MKLLALHEIEHTHGTVQLISQDGGNLQEKNGMVLVPQPDQTDPNDPLNWPLYKRIAAFYSILLFSALCNFCITGLAPGFEELHKDFGNPISQLSYLISVTGLGEAMGCFSVAPLASKFGKRSVWLACMLVFFICNVWSAVAKSFASLLVARLLATWAAGTSEPLSVSSLNDLFFLHERGTQAGVQSIWLCWGSSFAPVICGFLIQSKGWRWYHWLVSILAGFNLILIVLFVPETQYRRDLHKSLDVAFADSQSVGTDFDKSTGKVLEQIEDKTVVDRSRTLETTTQTAEKKTLLQQMKPWSPINRDVSLLASFIRPWSLWAYPSMVWGVMAFSIHVSCVVVLISLLPSSLGAPPYNFSVSAQGLVFLAPVIGNLAGALIGGHMNDYISHYSARKNNGVFEPEMRLPVVIFPATIVPLGLVLFGVGIHKQFHWIVPVIGVGCVGCGLSSIPSVTMPYLLDSYYPIAIDCLILFNGFKNFVSFGVGFAVFPWIDRDGIIAVFCILAALVAIIDSSVIFIYIFGKRLRAREAQLRILLF
ncbi:major facilitator superfamily domain-containing protein [Xylogone sp. PMI_703]|nr:major facilitator superfamily domain-containing protein [Xylogone sp. PMI_703]